jgi:hypothetical protein
MAEFDTIPAHNPTEEDFTVRFNGEPYTIEAGGVRQWVIAVALHYAKHFSDYILRGEFAKKRTPKAYKDNPKLREHDPEKIQYLMLDNPQRRIALYRILKNKVAVEDVIKKYPQFKYKETRNEFSFIGDLKEYDDFVANFENPSRGETTEGEKPTRGRPPKES